MKIDNKKFLFIGGAGLIGSHTIDLILKQDVKEIIVFDNFCRGKINNLENALKDRRVKIFDIGGDITQPDLLDEAMKNIDGVFHFAALWLLHCWDYPKSSFEVNVRGTLNILESMIKNNVKRLVYSSSASVYGNAISEPMKEDHPLNNTNFYGATKVASEQIIRAYYHRYLNKFKFVGLRYMNVYGLRQDSKGAYVAVIMKILENLKNNQSPIVYGDGKQSYDFINVKDCALANVLAMQSDRSDEFYNVGTGIKTSILELTQKILKLSGKDLKIKFKKSGQTFVTNRIGCTVKCEKELNFKANISLDEGLKEIINNLLIK